MPLRFADHLKDIPEYVPGKPVEELERELGTHDVLKLASNEGFRGPSPNVREAISKKIKELNLYPDSTCHLLRGALGQRFGVPMDRILVGNGSNYLIDLICRSVLNPGDEGITCDPTFAFYRRAIRGARGVHKGVPSTRSFEVEIDLLLKEVSSRTRLLFLASPNNPTGKIIPFSRLNELLKRLVPEIFLVLDEAYIDFVDSPEAGSGINLLADHPNLIVLRTFSKIHRLAGLRIGFALADPEIIRALFKLFLPFNVGSLGQAAAMASLEEETSLGEMKRINREGKAYLYRELKNLGLEFVPTQANFILVKVGKATRIYEGLLRRGIIVRDMTQWNLPEYLRITISLPEHNERLIRELKLLLSL
jgi:histidinol-phosphate aminotransferase